MASCPLCCFLLLPPVGPVSALLQHLRDQEKQDSLAAAQAKSGGTGTSGGQLSMHAAAVSGMVEVVDGAVSLRGRGLNSIPADVWQVGVGGKGMMVWCCWSWQVVWFAAASLATNLVCHLRPCACIAIAG